MEHWSQYVNTELGSGILGCSPAHSRLTLNWAVALFKEGKHGVKQ